MSMRYGPCRFDHNGECIICDCWISECAFQRWMKRDWRWESQRELNQMFQEMTRKALMEELYEEYEKLYESTGKPALTLPVKRVDGGSTEKKIPFPLFEGLILVDENFAHQLGYECSSKPLSLEERINFLENSQGQLPENEITLQKKGSEEAPYIFYE
jgi:hypothetical protein